MKKPEKKVAPAKKTVATKPKKAAAPKKKVAPVSKAAKKPAAKPVKAAKPKAAAPNKSSAAPVTILGSVLTAIKRSKNGIAIAKIKEKTGLEQRQLSNALYKLLKNGKVALKERGIYIASVTG